MDNMNEQEKRLRDFKANFELPEKEEPFPEGYEEIEEIVTNAQERLRQLDEEFRSPPKDKGPEPRLHPPGSIPDAKSATNQEERKAAIEKQKAQIKDEAWTNIENATKDGDPASDKKARDLSRERLFPNKYKDLDQQGMENERLAEKDMQLSQDFADAQFKPKEEGKGEKSAGDVGKGEGKATNEKSFSMSTRFSQSLSYPNFKEDNGKDQSVDKQLPKDKKPEMSMSFRFNQTSSFRNIDKETDISKDEPSKETKEIDRDMDD